MAYHKIEEVDIICSMCGQYTLIRNYTGKLDNYYCYECAEKTGRLKRNGKKIRFNPDDVKNT